MSPGTFCTSVICPKDEFKGDQMFLSGSDLLSNFLNLNAPWLARELMFQRCNSTRTLLTARHFVNSLYYIRQELTSEITKVLYFSQYLSRDLYNHFPVDSSNMKFILVFVALFCLAQCQPKIGMYFVYIIL